MPESLNKRFGGLNKKPTIRIRGLPDGTRIVVVSDMQVPFEDQALLRTIFEDFVPEFAPATKGAEYHLFLNGDVADLYNLSAWPANVEPKFTLTDEIEWVKEYLAAWGQWFTHKHYVFGNHEERWERELMKTNPKMQGFTERLDKALGLEELGYDWVPYGKHYDIQGFAITHGDTVVKNAAQRMLENYGVPGTSGHVNRPQSYTWSAAGKGEPITWYCTGMTCLFEIGDAIAAWRKIQPWQQGFLVGEVQGGILHVQLVRVIKKGFWAGGKFYKVKKEAK